MKIIHFTDPHRQKHFALFRSYARPHFNICADVEISALLAYLKEKQLSFTPSIVYLIAKTANAIPEFRWRLRGEQVVEHTSVHPSFTVLTEVSEVFSYCMVPYQNSYRAFYRQAQKTMEKMATDPSFEDEEGRDDYLFLSSFPWVSFTMFQHAMPIPADSVPRIAWGKYRKENEGVKMPLSVQAHHALVDGRHMGNYFEQFQKACLSPAEIFAH